MQVPRCAPQSLSEGSFAEPIRSAVTRIEIIIPADRRHEFVSIPGCTLDDLGPYYEFSSDAKTYVVIVLTWASSIPVGVISSYIYDALKKPASHEPHKPEKIAIDREWIESNHDLITKRVIERIRIER
jgi:hypothetical protein